MTKKVPLQYNIYVLKSSMNKLTKKPFIHLTMLYNIK